LDQILEGKVVGRLAAHAIIVVTTAVITAIAISYLTFFTLYWPGLVMFTGAVVGCILIFGLWVTIMVKRRVADRNALLRTSDYASLAIFISLLISLDFLSHFLPGWIWELIPFAAAILFYLPASMVAVAAVRMVSKPGAALILILGYGTVSQIIWPFFAWFPYYVVWAVFLETYFVTVNDYAKSMISTVLGGWVFGLVGVSFTIIYYWATLQSWTPLFLSIPNAFTSALAGALGAIAGSRIGGKARKISL